METTKYGGAFTSNFLPLNMIGVVMMIERTPIPLSASPAQVVSGNRPSTFISTVKPNHMDKHHVWAYICICICICKLLSCVAWRKERITQVQEMLTDDCDGKKLSSNDIHRKVEPKVLYIWTHQGWWWAQDHAKGSNNNSLTQLSDQMPP